MCLVPFFVRKRCISITNIGKQSFKISSILIKLVLKGILKELRHVYEAYTPLSDQKSHQAHFRENTRAQTLSGALLILQPKTRQILAIQSHYFEMFAIIIL